MRYSFAPRPGSNPSSRILVLYASAVAKSPSDFAVSYETTNSFAMASSAASGRSAASAASAGRKQRGSFSSLLLLEAHELSTLDSSPNSQRRGAMQAHIEDEFVTRGLEKGAPVASTRVAA